MRLELEYESIATIRRTLDRERDAREDEAARWEQAAAAEQTPARKRAAEELAAYRRAASFYFDGARVNFTMTIQLEPAEPEADQKGILLDLTDFF